MENNISFLVYHGIAMIILIVISIIAMFLGLSLLAGVTGFFGGLSLGAVLTIRDEIKKETK